LTTWAMTSFSRRGFFMQLSFLIRTREHNNVWLRILFMKNVNWSLFRQQLLKGHCHSLLDLDTTYASTLTTCRWSWIWHVLKGKMKRKNLFLQHHCSLISSAYFMLMYHSVNVWMEPGATAGVQWEICWSLKIAVLCSMNNLLSYY
jgi:hypothetical protein